MQLPLIVGFGGLNAAGRTSGFHAYKRTLADTLPEELMQDTWRDLAIRMKLISPDEEVTAEHIEFIKQNTLVRKIDTFDPSNIIRNEKVQVEVEGKTHDLLKPVSISLPVSSGGCLPNQCDPGALYKSHNHPRGLQLTIYGASDMMNSLGIKWEQILEHITPDQVAVYAGSALAQIDEYSLSGLISEPLKGNRVTSKMMPLSLAEMPADFVNSYVLNSVGTTGSNTGACATFLYNLRQGIMEIRSKKARVAIIGGAEAPIQPHLIEGFKAMSALAEDHQLSKLDESDTVNNRRAVRPFSSNAGFTLGESGQFIMLMDEELALETGATIYGSVADVFVNADANKKSISSPGIGNYVTVAKAAALLEAIEKEGLSKSFVHAHGTGTPQNRVTESHILNEVAKSHNLSEWPVAAVKSYVGHSVSAAAADQLMSTLGTWQYGWIPGIKTIDHIADDVFDSNLNILREDMFVGDKGQEKIAAILNAKGFGGNNASSLILSPQKTLEMLTKKHGEEALNRYKDKNVSVQAATQAHDKQAIEGQESNIYQFGTRVMDGHDVTLTSTSVSLSEFSQTITLPDASEYADYL